MRVPIRLPAQMKLTIVPLTFRQAADFVTKFHRHHKPARGCKFCIGVRDEEANLRGVAMVGRPIARHFDNGFTLEVNRTCTDGCKNANSCLYAAAWRTAKSMGYTRLITYTQEGESGVSLSAAGWEVVAELSARKNWAESSTGLLRELRDMTILSGVQRVLWEVTE